MIILIFILSLALSVCMARALVSLIDWWIDK